MSNAEDSIEYKEEVEELEEVEEESVDADSEVNSDIIHLPKSEAYSSADVANLFRTGVTHLIVLGGAQACGKTTLLGSIYERIQQGPFAGHKLCWSQTLCGFERICHEGRDASELASPTTLHTSRQSGRQYYELSLYSESQKCRQRLVFTDLSGEEFEDIRRYDDAVERLAIIRRADHFPLLVDGERISNVRLRHQALDEVRTILRTMIENHILTNITHVQIVFSKWDIVIQQDSSTSSVSFASHVEEVIARDFEDKFASLIFVRVAARDPAGDFNPAHGAEELIRVWVQNRRCEDKSQCIPLDKASRSFDLFSGMKN